MNIYTHRLATGTIGVLLSLVVAAPSPATESESVGLPLWEIGIGAAAYHQPNYPGSDVRSTTGFPFPYVIYRGDWFRIDRSLQGILYETPRIKVDFSAGSTAIVDNGESDARAGMPDLDPTFDVGPAMSLLLTDPSRPDSVWGRMAIRTAVSVDTSDWNFEQQGWILDTRLRYQRPLMGDTLKASAEIGSSFAERKYLGYFYDVAPEFATPLRPAFSTDAGYAGARIGLGLSGVSGKWRWSLFGAYMNFQRTPLPIAHSWTPSTTLAWAPPSAGCSGRASVALCPRTRPPPTSSTHRCLGCDLI